MAAPNILCDCTGMSEKRWLECREHGPKGDIEYTVGGSDVAVIFGLSPWTTPLELWMVKKGRMKPKAPPNPKQLLMGHMLEPIAAHFYGLQTGNTVIDDNHLYQHANLEYALANIDRRYMRKEDGESGVLECKSLTYHKAADWADGAIPIYYELQLRYYLAVMDQRHGAFSALWGNNPEHDLATPHIERDQAREDIIFEKLDRWIWSLRHDKPPTMEDVKPNLAMAALARIYGASKKGLPTIELPMKFEPKLRKIAALQKENTELKGMIKKNEEAIEAHSVRIAELMKNHEHGILTTTTDRLTLAPDHRESLLRRGLTDEAIERLGYKSTPVVGFHALAQSLLDEGYTLFGVPGFYRDEDGRWTMAVWRRGILIPGTYFGKIQGFQIRLDHKMKKGGKFLTFSSRDELDGTMGENWCHMVGPVREKILLIEGYMKADIVHHFTGQTMLAIPGVTSLQHLEAALKDLIPLGVRHVMTCFDMDYLKNWHVENAYRNLVTLLGKLDITFGTYLWVPDHNGLDDYIWEFCLNQGKAPE